jgi:hypothetical protein
LLVAGSVGTHHQAALALYAYLIFLGALILRHLLALATTALPPPGPSALEAAVRRREAPSSRIGEFDSLRQLLVLAEQSEFEFHFRLRPLLRDLAAARLARQRGLDLDSPAASSVLGATTWEVLRASRQPPEDRLARGPNLAALGQIVSDIERGGGI